MKGFPIFVLLLAGGITTAAPAPKLFADLVRGAKLFFPAQYKTHVSGDEGDWGAFHGREHSFVFAAGRITGWTEWPDQKLLESLTLRFE